MKAIEDMSADSAIGHFGSFEGVKTCTFLHGCSNQHTEFKVDSSFLIPFVSYGPRILHFSLYWHRRRKQGGEGGSRPLDFLVKLKVWKACRSKIKAKVLIFVWVIAVAPLTQTIFLC